MSFLSKVDQLVETVGGLVGAVSSASIGGIQPQYSNVTISFGGKQFKGVLDISYKETIAPGYIQGGSNSNLSQTVGIYSASGSCTMAIAWAKQFEAGLGDEYMTKLFDISLVVSWDGATTQSIKLKDCRILGKDNSWAQGADALVTKFDIYIDQVVTDGRVAVKKS